MQSFEYIEGTDLLLIARWNSNVIEVVSADKWVQVGLIDINDYAPYSVLEIETV